MALVAAVWLAAIGSGCSDETILMPAGEGNPVKVLASIDRFSGILTKAAVKRLPQIIVMTGVPSLIAIRFGSQKNMEE